LKSLNGKRNKDNRKIRRKTIWEIGEIAFGEIYGRGGIEYVEEKE